MANPPTTSQFDLYLGEKSDIRGYRVRSYVRDSAPQVAPRFSSGAEGETNLDMLKATSVKDMAGGMFQRDWADDTKVARSIGIYNPYNSMFYPAPAPAAADIDLSTQGRYLAKTENELYSFIAFGRWVTGSGAGTGYVSKLYKLTKATGSLSAITLPVAYTTNAPCWISDLAIHKDYLYISAQDSAGNKVNNHSMKIGTNVFQDMTGYGVIMRSLRGTLYHINHVSYIYSVGNETSASAASYSFLDTTGHSDQYIAVPTDAVEFNGALWIAKPEGIYRFDGIKAVKVLGLRTSKFTVYNGAIYFISRNWLYKFDGTNVTRLQFFGATEIITSMTSNADYLFIQSLTETSAIQAVTDKPFAIGSSLRRIYMYDGQGFSMLSEVTMSDLNQTPSCGILYTADTLLDVYSTAINSSTVADFDIYYSRHDLLEFFVNTAITATAQFDVTSSEFDGGYPNIYKSLNIIELSYSGLITDDSLTVKYQIYDGTSWGSWITLGTITSTSDSMLEIQTDSEMLFKRIKVNIAGTFAANSTFAFKGLTLRWTLQPRVRWRWQTTLAAHGTDEIDRFNVNIVSSANALNNAITKSIKQKTPLYKLSPDYGVVKTAVTDIATSIEIDGDVPIYTDPYSEYPLVAVQNSNSVWEILQVTNVAYDGTKTTLTIKERGYLGIAAASISAGAEFHLCYRVYVTRLMNDRTILSDETYDEQSTKNSQLKREFALELIEV